MKTSHATARALGFATAIVWGLSFLSIKVAVAEIPPMTLGLARFIVAVAILPLVALFVKEPLRVKAVDLPRLAASGLIGVTLYFLCENNGILLLSASEASLVIGTIPVATMLAERLFLKTKLGAKAYVGAFLSFAGVGLIAARSAGAASTPLGFLYMVGAALSWVAYSFVTRPLGARYGRVTITFWQSFFGMLGFLPFIIGELASIRAPSAGALLQVAYLGVFCSAIGYWFYVVSLDVLGAGPASAFINLIPVVSVVAAFAVLGERLAGLQLAGGAIAVIGVWMATAPSKKRA